MNTKFIIIVLAAIGSVAALWVARFRFVESELIREQLAVSIQEFDHSVLVDPEVETLKALIAAREREIEQLEAEAISNSSVSSSVGENSVEIEEWLERINHLSGIPFRPQ